MAYFTDRTYENILKEMLAMAPKGVDVRQGSIYYDSVSSCALKLANFYVDAGLIIELTSLWTAPGEWLDQKGREHNLERNAATPARYRYVYNGTKPAVGTRFFTDGLFFVLEETDGALYLVAEEAGEASNSVLEGTPATPVVMARSLQVSEFGTLVEPGADTEGDDDYRLRIQEKIAGPAQNGNKQHYKTWCEEVDGVGRARILPLWAGQNTVKGVLLDTDGLPAAETVVERVQEYVDPGGTGLGEGKANIGAYFTAVAAQAVPITISCTIALATGYSLQQAQEAATEAFRTYLKELALDTPDKTPMVVRMSRIGATLYDLEAVIDYEDLTINGLTRNIEITKEQVAVLEGVELYGPVR